MAQAPGRSREGRRGDRERAIVAAALAEFSAKGFAAARLDDVARRAGVAKGTLYLYFDGKDALFQAVIRQAILPRIADAEALAAGFDGPTEALLRRMLKTLGREIVETEAGEAMRLVIAEAGRFPELTAFYYRSVVRRGLDLVRGVVARGVARGEFRPSALDEHPQLLVAPLILAVIWTALFQRLQPIDLERLLDGHLDLLLDGLRTR